MDPLSVAASVCGLIALTGKCAELSRSLFRSVRRRPELLRRLAEELDALQAVLVDLNRRLSDESMDEEREEGKEEEAAALVSVSSACEDAVRALQEQLSGLRDMFAKNVFGRLCCRAKFAGALEEVAELRGQLAAFKLTLGIALQLRVIKQAKNQCEGLRRVKASIELLSLHTERLGHLTSLHPIQQYIGISTAVLHGTRQNTTASDSDGNSTNLASSVSGVGDGMRTAAPCPGDAFENSINIVKSSGSFEDWLVSFAPEDASASPHGAVEDSLSSVTDPSTAPRRESAIIQLKVCNLGPREDEMEVIELRMADQFHHAIETLQQKGYKRVCGFRVGARTLAPFVRLQDPMPVYVTSKASSYSLDWLRINQHESLEDFYDDAVRTTAERLPLEASIVGSGLQIRNAFHGTSATVYLNQTILVPQDGVAYHPPPPLLPFPLLDVESLGSSLLPQAVKSKSGLVMPVYSREAISISFVSDPARSWRDTAAVRVVAGGINAISCRPQDEPADDVVQDYVTLPHQKRLDGFMSKSEDGRGLVTQFVAMPTGGAHSAEAQATGGEYLNGVQFIVAPPRARGTFYSAVEPCYSTIEEQSASPASLGLRTGDVVYMAGNELQSRCRKDGGQVNHGSAVPAGLRPTRTHEVLLPLTQRLGDYCEPLEVEAVSLMTITIKVRGGESHIPLTVSPFIPVEAFYEMVAAHMKTRSRILIVRPCGKFLPREHAVLYDVCFDGIVLDCFEPGPICGFGGPTEPMASEPGQPIASTWEMALGLGGKLYQDVYADNDPARWNWKKARLFNVQFINAVAFQALTGVAPLAPPMPFAAFVEAGIPFHYLLPPSSGTLDCQVPRKIPSIAEIMSERRVSKGTAVCGLDPVGCVSCARMLCDTILVPCNHIFCAQCVGEKMQHGDGVVCAACKTTSHGQIRFAGAMRDPTISC